MLADKVAVRFCFETQAPPVQLTDQPRPADIHADTPARGHTATQHTHVVRPDCRSDIVARALCTDHVYCTQVDA